MVRLHVMYQLPFIARLFDKVIPALEEGGKHEKDYIEALTQFSTLFNKYDKESLPILERFFAGESASFTEAVTFADLKGGLLELIEASFFKPILEPEIP